MPTIDINLALWAVAFTWHYCLFCGYVSDDHSAVERRKDIIPDEEKVDRGEGFWTKRFNDGLLMFYHNQLFWKMGFTRVPFMWHAFSLTIHLVNTYLLYYLLLPVFGDPIALYATAFWAVNPMLNQNIVWISGRPYIFGTFIALTAMHLWHNPFLFMVFYALGVLTNINIFFIPVLTWVIHPNTGQTNSALLSILFVALPILIWKFNKRFTKGLVLDRDNFKFRRRKLNTFARMTAYYCWTLIFPCRMGWYHQAGFRYNEKWEKFNYQTLIGYLMIIAMLYWFPLAGVWFILGLLPVSNLWATNSFLQDRYLYFLSIGFAIIVANLFVAYPVMFWCAMTFYISRAYTYSRQLKNDESLYRENWRNHQQSDYAINNLSYFLIQQHRYDESRVVIERGLAINRLNKMLWYNLGICWAAQGHFGNDEGKFRFIKAIDCFKMALQIEPRWMNPASSMKQIIALLVERKVLTLEKDNSAHGISITVPNLVGMEQILNGTSSGSDSAKQIKETVPAETLSTTAGT